MGGKFSRNFTVKEKEEPTGSFNKKNLNLITESDFPNSIPKQRNVVSWKNSTMHLAGRHRRQSQEAFSNAFLPCVISPTCVYFRVEVTVGEFLKPFPVGQLFILPVPRMTAQKGSVCRWKVGKTEVPDPPRRTHALRGRYDRRRYRAWDHMSPFPANAYIPLNSNNCRGAVSRNEIFPFRPNLRKILFDIQLDVQGTETIQGTEKFDWNKATQHCQII